MTCSPKEAAVLVSHAKRLLRRPRAIQERPRMNETEILVRYAKLHLAYMQVLEQLQSSQRECAKLQQRIEELTPKPLEPPQPTESQLVSEAT